MLSTCLMRRSTSLKTRSLHSWKRTGSDFVRYLSPCMDTHRKTRQYPTSPSPLVPKIMMPILLKSIRNRQSRRGVRFLRVIFGSRGGRECLPDQSKEIPDMERFLEDALTRFEVFLHLCARREYNDLWEHAVGILPSGAHLVQEVNCLVCSQETQIQEQHHGEIYRVHDLVSPGEGGVPATTHRSTISRQLKCPAEQVLDRGLLLGDQDVRGSRGSACSGKRLVSACVASVIISSRHTNYFLSRKTSAGP